MRAEIQVLKASIKMWERVSGQKPLTNLVNHCDLCDFVYRKHDLRGKIRYFGSYCEESCPGQGFWHKERVPYACEMQGASYDVWKKELDSVSASYVVDDLKTCLDWWEDLREMNS